MTIAMRPIPYLLLVTAMTFWGKAMWIHAKAQLAQILIASSWQETLNSQQPEKPWPWADTWPVGKLIFPADKTRLYVLAGTDGSALAFGPGMDMQSPLDNRIIHGHRETHFSILKNLKIHDFVYLENTNGQQQKYRVTQARVIDTSTSQLWITPDSAGLILITCYPFHSVNVGGPLRYVVEAKPLKINKEATIALDDNPDRL